MGRNELNIRVSSCPQVLFDVSNVASHQWQQDGVIPFAYTHRHPEEITGIIRTEPRRERRTADALSAAPPETNTALTDRGSRRRTTSRARKAVRSVSRTRCSAGAPPYGVRRYNAKCWRGNGIRDQTQRRSSSSSPEPPRNRRAAS